MTVAHHFGVVDLALRRYRVLHRAIALNALVQCPLRVVRGLFADGQVLTHIRRRSGLLRSPGIIRRCNPDLFRHGLLTLGLNLFCALLIFTTRPFREGDVVEVIDSGALSWPRRAIVAVLVLNGIGFIALQQLRWNELAPVHEDLVAAFNEARYVAFLVEDHYQQQGKLPKDLAQLPISGKGGNPLRLSLDANNGVIQIRGSSAALANRRLYLIPHPTSDKRLIWECRSDEFPIEYLPAGCEFKPYAPARAATPEAAPTPAKPQTRR